MDKYTIDHAIAFYRDIPTGQYDDEAVEALEFYRDHQWQPIETAPKDGQTIDLWSGNGRYADCKWHPTRGFVHWWVDGFDTFEWVRLDYPPTHWMPLPPPPAGV